MFSGNLISRAIKLSLVIALVIQLSACATNFRQALQNLEAHNYPEALHYFEQDAKLGYRIPALHAANLYILDYQVPRDLEKSRLYLDIAEKADYGRYDQAYDYYIPLIKAYQILADTEEPDKSLAFKILKSEKYQEYYWALAVLAHSSLVGHGTERNLDNARYYFEKSIENQVFDSSNAFYAWWLATYPNDSFRNPQRALEMIEDIIDDEDLSDRPLFLDTAAAVYAANGLFERAVITQRDALSSLKYYSAKHHYMEQYQAPLNARLEWYESGKPWIFSDEEIALCGYDSKRCMKSLLSVTPIDKMSLQLDMH